MKTTPLPDGGELIEYASGSRFWYLNGQLHRTDGPAIEYTDGSRVWYCNGLRHREDAPAIEGANGYRAWYLNGRKVTEAEINERSQS